MWLQEHGNGCRCVVLFGGGSLKVSEVRAMYDCVKAVSRNKDVVDPRVGVVDGV